jgi:hypothetical protein
MLAQPHLKTGHKTTGKAFPNQHCKTRFGLTCCVAFQFRRPPAGAQLILLQPQHPHPNPSQRPNVTKPISQVLDSYVFHSIQTILQNPPEAELILLQPQHLQHRLAGK